LRDYRAEPVDYIITGYSNAIISQFLIVSNNNMMDTQKYEVGVTLAPFTVRP